MKWLQNFMRGRYGVDQWQRYFAYHLFPGYPFCYWY